MLNSVNYSLLISLQSLEVEDGTVLIGFLMVLVRRTCIYYIKIKIYKPTLHYITGSS